jgi:hypothetical protein
MVVWTLIGLPIAMRVTKPDLEWFLAELIASATCATSLQIRRAYAKSSLGRRRLVSKKG